MAFALAPAVATVLGVSATTANIITSAALLAGTTAIQIFMARSEEQPEPDRGQKLLVALGGAVPQSILFGETETAGHLYYAGTWGRPGMHANNYAVEAYIMADLTAEGSKSTFWYGGRKCTIDLDNEHFVDGSNIGHPVTTLRKGGQDYVWVKFHDGSQTEADSYLRAKFGGSAKRPYTNKMIGYGRPLAIVTIRYDKEGSGIQEQLFVYKGSRFYDPRKDSTNGGSGSHRWGQRNTYEFTKNRAVIYYNIRRGIYRDDERLFGGLNYPAYMLDNDSYFASMNKCDENFALAGGGTEKRFEGGGEIDLSGRVTDALNKLLIGMNGRVTEDGGISKLFVGPIGASVLSITDGDLIVTERREGDECPHPDDIFNIVTGTYIEPGDAGETASFRKKTDADALARDGVEITKPLDLPWVRSNTQAQRLAKLALKEGQRWRKRAIVLPPYARKLRPCDVITWTSEKEGWSNKKFICGDVTIRKNGLVQVRLTEADASDGDWTVDDEDAFDTGEFDDVVPDPEDFTATITAVGITDDTGKNRRPGIRFEPSTAVLSGFTWGDIKSEFEDCAALLWQVRKKNGSQKVIAKGRSDDFFEDGEDEVSRHAFLPSLQVQVKYRIELANGRLTGWSGWNDLTLGAYGIDDEDTTDDTLAAPSKPVLAQVQDDDEDGKVSNDLYMTTVPPAWATGKTRYEWEITVGVRDPIIKRSGSSNYEYKIRKTGVAIVVRTRAVKGVGKESAWSASETITPSKKANSVPTPANVSASAKPKGNRVKGDDPNMKDLKWALFYRHTANNSAAATLAEKRKGLAWRDDDPPGNVGDTAFYWMRFVDNSDNIGSFSVVATCVNKGVEDSDLDDTAPNTPGVPSFTTSSADVDKDGKQETFLTAAWTQGGSVTAKTHNLEIWRSSTIGGTYALWKEFEVDGTKLQKKFQANSNFFYKGRVKAKGGAKLGSSAFSLLTTTGVQPVARGFNLSVGSVGVTWESYRRKHVVKVNNLPIDDPEFAYVEIYQRTGASTYTRVDRGKKDKFEFFNPPSNVQKYRARIFTATQATNSVDYESSGTAPTVGNDGIDDIVAGDLSPGCVTTVKIEDSGVTGPKLAHNIVEVYEKFLGAGTTDNVVVDLPVDHGDADQIAVWAYFVNNEGSLRNNVDVSLETGAGVTFANMNVDIEDGNPVTIFGRIGGLSGSTTTVQLRVSGGFNKKDRHIMAQPVW